MIVTTTQTVEGRQIAEYKGIVFGEVVSGVNFVKDLFSGITEVKSCGGLLMKLTVKSKVQGLSQEFPRRRFYPQGTYSTSGGKVSSSTEEDSASVIAPYVPLKEVLL